MKLLLLFLILSPLTISAGHHGHDDDHDHHHRDHDHDDDRHHQHRDHDHDDDDDDDDPTKCPSIDIDKDYAQVKKDLSIKVYSAIIDGADELTEAVLDDLRCLTESDDYYQSIIAYIVAVYLSDFLPHLDNLPTFCGFAQLINASVSTDPDQLRCALDAASDLSKITTLYKQQNSIDVSGCASPSVIEKLECAECWEDGLAYEVDLLWKRRSHVLPDEFCNHVHHLYQSEVKVNRLLALFISYTITEQIEVLLRKFPLTMSLQTTSLEFGWKIPKCCCPKRLSILQTLNEDVSEQIKEILDGLKPPCVCPSLKVSQDEYEELYRNTSNFLVENAPCSLTDVGTAVREELKAMANSDNESHRNIASTVLNVYQNFATNLHILPSLCAYAAFINETVAYIGDKTKSRIVEALDEVIDFVPHVYYLIHVNSVIASGCKGPPVAKPAVPAPEGCYKDGYAYEADRIWSIRNETVPPTLPKKAIALYESKSQLDRILASILTFVVADPVIYSLVEQDIFTQSIKAVYSDPIPKCCCTDRLEDAYNIEVVSTTSVVKAVENYKKTFLG